MDDGSELDPGPATQAMPIQAPTGWVLGGRYRVLDRIGTGGMAEVFRARDELLNRDVAVKVFRTPVDEPGNSASLERRQLELRALAQLSHPNLITLFDGSITDGGTSFLVMELVIGQDLAARLREGPLEPEEAGILGAQVADALDFVHARGMVHRDVKPANILLGVDGSATDPGTMRARLSDFGIVRMIDNARLTAVAFTLGTASYLAPEQAIGADVGAAADIYALGLVLIEALTGVRSFEGPQHEAVAARLVRSPDIPLGLRQPWPDLLAAMTARDPAARPSAADVARRLRSAAVPVLPPPVVRSPPVVPPLRVPPSDFPPSDFPPSDFPPPVAPVLAGFVSANAPPPAADDNAFIAPHTEPDRARPSVALIIAALAFVAVLVGAGILIVLSLQGASPPATSPGVSGSVAGTDSGSPSTDAPRTTASAPTTSATPSPTRSSSSSSPPSSSSAAPSSSSGSGSSSATSSSSVSSSTAALPITPGSSATTVSPSTGASRTDLSTAGASVPAAAGVAAGGATSPGP